jgi:DNA-binding CsgD family transcriptional regulator
VNRRALLEAAAATAIVAAMPWKLSPRAVPRPRWISLGVLTRPERRVALLLGRGLTIPEIAQVFGVSRRTLEVHIYMILKKLDVRTRSELIDLFRGVDRLGWTLEPNRHR